MGQYHFWFFFYIQSIKLDFHLFFTILLQNEISFYNSQLFVLWGKCKSPLRAYPCFSIIWHCSIFRLNLYTTKHAHFKLFRLSSHKFLSFKRHIFLVINNIHLNRERFYLQSLQTHKFLVNILPCPPTCRTSILISRWRSSKNKEN